MGVVQFESERKETCDQFKNSTEIEDFKKNMIENFDSFTVDVQRDSLKRYIHLMNGQSDELNIMKTTLIKYNEAYHSKMHKVTEFVFGTEIMRLMYFLNSYAI